MYHGDYEESYINADGKSTMYKPYKIINVT